MIIAADATNVLKHIIVSDREGVTASFFFLAFLTEAKKAGSVQCLFSRLHPLGDYSDLCPVSQTRPAAAGTDGKVGQGLGHISFANLDTGF